MLIIHQDNVAGFAGAHTVFFLPQQVFASRISITTVSAQWGDRLDYQESEFSGATGTLTFTSVDVGDVLLIRVSVDAVDEPISTVSSDQDGNFDLQQLAGTNQTHCYAKLKVTSSGTHVVTITPTAPVSLYTALASGERVYVGAEDAVFDTTPGIVITDTTTIATTTTSPTITASNSPAMLHALYSRSPIPTASDTDWGQTRDEIISGYLTDTLIQETATTIDYTVTHVSSGVRRMITLASYVKSVGGGGAVLLSQYRGIARGAFSRVFSRTN